MRQGMKKSATIGATMAAGEGGHRRRGAFLSVSILPRTAKDCKGG